MKKQELIFAFFVLLVASGCSNAKDLYTHLFKGGQSSQGGGDTPAPTPAGRTWVSATSYGKFKAPSNGAPVDALFVVDLANDPRAFDELEKSTKSWIESLTNSGLNFHLGFIDAGTEANKASLPSIVGDVISQGDANAADKAAEALRQIEKKEHGEVYAEPTADLLETFTWQADAQFFRPDAYRMYVFVTAPIAGNTASDSVQALDEQSKPFNWRVFSLETIDSCFPDSDKDSLQRLALANASGGKGYCGVENLANMISDMQASLQEQRTEISIRQMIEQHSELQIQSVSVLVNGSDWTNQVTVDPNRWVIQFSSDNLPPADALIEVNITTAYPI